MEKSNPETHPDREIQAPASESVATAAPEPPAPTFEVSAAVASPPVLVAPSSAPSEVQLFSPAVPPPYPSEPVAPVPLAAPAPPVALPLPGAVAPSPPPVPAEPVVAQFPRPGLITPLVALLAGGTLACLLVVLGMFLQARHGAGGAIDPINYIGGPGVSSESGNAIVRAVRLVGPAVMNVDTTFGKQGSPEILPDPGLGPQPLEGKGTGVVIDSRRGLMLTNAHVVAGAQAIQVTSREGKQYTGRIKGSDRLTDIAVVELSDRSLPEAKLAHLKNSRDLDIGQWAIAIGNPFAQANTVTVGVVSAVGRSIEVPGGRAGGQGQFRLTDMIQTDAAINPGNSGGPLCNIRGEVIGINTAIIPFATGLGFTIPINKAKAVADQLIVSGKVQHPYIGVAMWPITAEKQQFYGLPDRNGAIVKSVETGSPAAQAGLQPGDVIRTIDGKSMKSNVEVQQLIGDKKVGDTIKIDILRNNTVKRTINVKLGDRPGTE